MGVLSEINNLVKLAAPVKDAGGYFVVNEGLEEEARKYDERVANSKNPMVRAIVDHFGRLGAHPDNILGIPVMGYMESPRSLARSEFERQIEWLAEQDMLDTYRRTGELRTIPSWKDYAPKYSDPNKRMAYMDLLATAGYPYITSNYYRGETPEDSVAYVPGYPRSEKTMRHEIGHGIDHKNGTLPLHGDAQDILNAERRAWDNAGIHEGDPLREAALSYYDPRNIRDLSFIINLHRRMAEISKKEYKPPSEWAELLRPQGVPMAYDYTSLTNAWHGGASNVLDRAVATIRTKDFNLGQPESRGYMNARNKIRNQQLSPTGKARSGRTTR